MAAVTGNYWNTTRTAGTNIIGGSWLGGNYWSDYTGVDTDGDGLGDTILPYNTRNFKWWRLVTSDLLQVLLCP